MGTPRPETRPRGKRARRRVGSPGASQELGCCKHQGSSQVGGGAARIGHTRPRERHHLAYTREHECRCRVAGGREFHRSPNPGSSALASERLVDLAPGPTGNNGADWKLRLETTLILETSVSANIGLRALVARLVLRGSAGLDRQGWCSPCKLQQLVLVSPAPGHRRFPRQLHAQCVARDFPSLTADGCVLVELVEGQGSTRSRQRSCRW